VAKTQAELKEKRFLCVSDLHGDIPQDVTDEAGYAGWLVAGDIALDGNGKQFVKWSLKRTTKLYAVSGNHDSGVFGSYLLNHHYHGVSGMAERICSGLILVGVGWCGSFNYQCNILPTEKELGAVCKAAAKAARKIKMPGDATILLTHYPPKLPGIAAYSEGGPGRFYGCVRSMVDLLKPVAVVHGHSHELFCTQVKYGKTLLCCPGPEATVLTIGKDGAAFVPWAD
jgi:Icc-related predicted phosphoesterase